MNRFFDMVDQLNSAAPAHIVFVANAHDGYYGKDCKILMHDFLIGSVSVRGWDGKKPSFSFMVNMGSGYSLEVSEVKKAWEYTTKGLIPKMLELIENMIDESRINLSSLYHNKQWSAITLRDFNALLSTNDLEEFTKKFEYSGVKLTIHVPGALKRKEFPRVYKFILNGNWLFNGYSVTIKDPTLKAVVQKINNFERQLKKVLNDD